MDYYDPEISPDAEAWLRLDDDEKILLIETFHNEGGIEPPEGGASLHAAMHALIENQVAMQTEGVCEAIARLTRQGLPRHEAVHAIGAVLSEDIVEMLHGNSEEFNVKRYKTRLGKLTAKRWKKGKW